MRVGNEGGRERGKEREREGRRREQKGRQEREGGKEKKQGKKKRFLPSFNSTCVGGNGPSARSYLTHCQVELSKHFIHEGLRSLLGKPV